MTDEVKADVKPERKVKVSKDPKGAIQKNAAEYKKPVKEWTEELPVGNGKVKTYICREYKNGVKKRVLSKVTKVIKGKKTRIS